ncbi:Suppressor of Sensor Kinase (SLN1) [Dispira simplex]|nr:Suppressor of Sensor Kinase (SLN1) [Dispira simplex]
MAIDNVFQGQSFYFFAMDSTTESTLEGIIWQHGGTRHRELQVHTSYVVVSPWLSDEQKLTAFQLGPPVMHSDFLLAKAKPSVTPTGATSRPPLSAPVTPSVAKLQNETPLAAHNRSGHSRTKPAASAYSVSAAGQSVSGNLSAVSQSFTSFHLSSSAPSITRPATNTTSTPTDPLNDSDPFPAAMDPMQGMFSSWADEFNSDSDSLSEEDNSGSESDDEGSISYRGGRSVPPSGPGRSASINTASHSSVVGSAEPRPASLPPPAHRKSPPRSVKLHSSQNERYLRVPHNRFLDHVLAPHLTHATSNDATTSSNLGEEKTNERFEWQSVLSSALTGELMKSEKKRLKQSEAMPTLQSHNAEIWLELRAYISCQSVIKEENTLTTQRARIPDILHEVQRFRLPDECTDTLTALSPVKKLLARLDFVESLYPTRKELSTHYPVYASSRFQAKMEALISWCSTNISLITYYTILQKWTGSSTLQTHEPSHHSESLPRLPDKQANEPATEIVLEVIPPAERSNATRIESVVDNIDFSKLTAKADLFKHLSNIKALKRQTQTSFIERLLKENGLAKTFGSQTLKMIDRLLWEVRNSMQTHYKEFEFMRLPCNPPSLVPLLQFPSNLLLDYLRIRLEYFHRNPPYKLTSLIIVEQMLEDMRYSLQLSTYYKSWHSEIVGNLPHWPIKVPIDTEYDSIMLDYLRFYYQLVMVKLRFPQEGKEMKETDYILTEWTFIQKITPHIKFGEWETAKQFCEQVAFVSKRLLRGFERRLQNPPLYPPRKVYNFFSNVMNNFRIRLRKLSALLSKDITMSLLNSAQYHFDHAQPLVDALLAHNHTLLYTGGYFERQGVYIFCSPACLQNHEVIDLLLYSCISLTILDELPGHLYLVLIRTDTGIHFPGNVVQENLEYVDLRLPRNTMRLVSNNLQTLDYDRTYLIPLLTQRDHPVGDTLPSNPQTSSMDVINLQPWRHSMANIPKVDREIRRLRRLSAQLIEKIINCAYLTRSLASKLPTVDVVQECFVFIFGFSKQFLALLDLRRQRSLRIQLLRMCIEWLNFIILDCDQKEPKTHRWTVAALDATMNMTNNGNVLNLDDAEFETLKKRVGTCFSTLIHHINVFGIASDTERRIDRSSAQAQYLRDRRLSRLKLIRGTYRRVTLGTKPDQDDQGQILVNQEATRTGDKSKQNDNTLLSPFFASEAAGSAGIGTWLSPGRAVACPLLYDLAEIPEESDEPEEGTPQVLTPTPEEEDRWVADRFLPSFQTESRLALAQLEGQRYQHLQAMRLVGRVLDLSHPENQPLVYLASFSSNISIRWQQGKLIGRGTFGDVYAALNLDTGELMAVKEIKFPDVVSLRTMYKDLVEEMAVMEVLDHPNVVSYHGVEVHRDRVYIFMELCQQGSMKTLLDNGPLENEDYVRTWTLQILRGLLYLHRNGIVHRDIKPDNLLFNDQGLVKLVDFGAAKVLAQNHTLRRSKKGEVSKLNANSGLVGTPMYMAPEVIASQECGRHGAQDIWSLGCCVLAMVTGRHPWPNLDNQWAIMFHAVTSPPPLPDPSQFSTAGLNFLKQCFIHNPNQRPSAQELLDHPWLRGADQLIQQQIQQQSSYSVAAASDPSLGTNGNSGGITTSLSSAEALNTSDIGDLVDSHPSTANSSGVVNSPGQGLREDTRRWGI